MAAFDHVKELTQAHESLTAAQIREGFWYEGSRIPLVNPQRGIFKPKRMQYLLSIRTTVPKPGGKVWYEDQVEAHRQIYASDRSVEYAFMGTNPNAADNQWLLKAYENQVPVIYFLGTSPGQYQAIIWTFISAWNPGALKAEITFGLPIRDSIESPPGMAEQQYVLRTVKQRLHQASFRNALIAAYKGRCAVTGLPEHRLLDAAHIVPDTDEQLGQPVVPNGLLLSKIHHAAFDSNLIGIDPDYRVHVSENLLEKRDGPMLETLKQIDGGVIHLPSRSIDRPDRDRLAHRFEIFRQAA